LKKIHREEKETLQKQVPTHQSYPNINYQIGVCNMFGVEHLHPNNN
jgi:hypothetical protein